MGTMWKIAVASAVLLALLATGAVLTLRHLERAGLQIDAFDDDIAAFEAGDRDAPPPEGAVVFVGSSSIRFWDSLEADMAPLPVIRRGFGGAHMAHVTRHAERIVHAYAPAVVVVYAGDNDLSAVSDKTPADVVRDFATFASALHAALPDTQLLFIAIKPSIRRFDRWPLMRAGNEAIAAFAEADPRISVIDVASPMLGADGEPREELFAFDGLHLSDQGYALWAEVVRPAVETAWQARSGRQARKDAAAGDAPDVQP